MYKNPDGSYMDEWHIIAHMFLVSVKDEKTLALIRNGFEYDSESPEAKKALELGLNLGNFERFQLGMWIRNTYGLNRPDNPHIAFDPEPNAEGIIDHPRHPDNLSGWIIERFIKLLNTPPPEFTGHLLQVTNAMREAEEKASVVEPNSSIQNNKGNNLLYRIATIIILGITVVGLALAWLHTDGVLRW